MVKKFIKSKSEPDTGDTKYRTPDHFKGSIFGSGKFNKFQGKNQRFSHTTFRTQHKG